MDNPVDWYPYSEIAFRKAKIEDKMIFLSIGYSSCHWCHVMAHESFEDEEIADILNTNFVSIKVDREERPDIDQIYQSVIQLMGRNGGWPLSIFLTPDGKPFFAGTYFPSKPRYGITSFPDLLNRLISVYKERKSHVNLSANQIVASLKKISEEISTNQDSKPKEITEEVLMKAIIRLEDLFDPVFGGFGGAPKFPNFTTLIFIMRFIGEKARFNSESFRKIKKLTENTLNHIANGGIYDHLGFGFHRYSVDQKWLTPHFEKMLYDNAMALVAYSEGYRVFNNPRYKEIVREIIDWAIKEMYVEGKGFFSSQDADSEGKEGLYYIWKKEELDKILLEEERELFYTAYGVTKNGNFEDNSNILNRVFGDKELAKKFELTELEVGRRLANIKNRLFQIRNERIHPKTDDKILTSWNLLFIHGLFSAFHVLKDPVIKEIAHTSLQFFINNMYKKSEGVLYSVYDYNTDTKKNLGNLDDYAYFLQVLIDDFQINQDDSNLRFIKRIMQDVDEQFWEEKGGYFYSSSLKKDILVRMKKTGDQPLPGTNSIMGENLLRLHYITGEKEYLEKAEVIMKILINSALKYPSSYGTFFSTILWYLFGSTDLEVFFKPPFDIEEFIHTIEDYYIPRLHLSITDTPKLRFSLLKDKIVEGDKTTYYLCHKFNCLPPVTNQQKLMDYFDNSFIKID